MSGTRDSGQTLAEVIAGQIDAMRADEILLKPFLANLHTESNFTAEALFASVGAAILETPSAVGELEEVGSSANACQKLSYRDLVQYEYGTAMFRTLAMAGRLGHLVDNDALRIAACHALQARLTTYKRSARLVPVSLESSTGLQMASIIVAASNVTVASVSNSTVT